MSRDLPPFEFAVVSEGAATGTEWRQFVTKAEELGYDAIFITDHIGQPMAPLPALAAAAAMTTRIRLGTFVLNADLRNRELLGHEVRTIRALAGSRLILGLGAGWLRDDYSRAGASLDGGASRFQRISAALASMSTGTEDGPTLLIGGGRRRMLGLAAARADIVSVLPALGPDGPESYSDMTPARVDEKVRWIREAAQKRDTPPVLNHVVWECFILPRPAPVIAALASAVNCGAAELPGLTGFLVGTPEQVAEAVAYRRTRWGFSLVTVPEAALEPFGEVIRLLRPVADPR